MFIHLYIYPIEKPDGSLNTDIYDGSYSIILKH